MFYFSFKQVILHYTLWFTVLKAEKPDDKMSMEEMIFHAASSPEMLDFFHVMPDGDVRVLTEFDLMLTMDQYKALHMPEKERNRPKRKALNIAREFSMWPNNTVYYDIADSFDDTGRNVILEAIEHWQKYTCLTFEETDSQPNRIQFKDGKGCSSHVGMLGKPQDLVLGRGCRVKGLIIHEIGHAIGWLHEHMRPDRDDYIYVNLNAIQESFHKNYAKYPNYIINSYDVQYDYQSVMHYGTGLFPKSIETYDKDYQDKIGQRLGLSFKDIKLANIMYQCAEKNQCQNQTCEHGGFQLYESHTKKCECWCDSENIEDPLILCSKLKKSPTTDKPKIRPTITPLADLCFDVSKDCNRLKADGKCMTMMEAMIGSCSKTCNFCGKGKGMCMDMEKSCYLFVKTGVCKDPAFEKVMKTLCPASCGFCSEPSSPCDMQLALMGPENRGRKSEGFLVLTFLTVFLTTVLNCPELMISTVI